MSNTPRCPNCNGAGWGTDEDGRYCLTCKEPGPDAAKPRTTKASATTPAVAGPADIPSDALAFDTDDLTRILRVGARTVWRWSRSGTMPQPCKVGGRVLWAAHVIRQWVADGMPRVDGRASR